MSARPNLPEIQTSRASDPALAGIKRALCQLREYFAGKRRIFDLQLRTQGTDFQRRAWRALLAIPYGETRTYGQQAAALGSANASRAVGRANSLNPLPIVVPCHRVIGSKGQLTGFAGGLERKRWLLEHEGAHKDMQLDLLPAPVSKRSKANEARA
ncbi:MAG TPA: methylated-DNA--[protein]-cysteine S-methyltransferase [Nannocystis exedens]|nr:methylated-DNA--[protein]-cysteine S-methyltransferase [Nannocystis exedens]